MEIDEYDYDYICIWESLTKKFENKSDNQVLQYFSEIEHFRNSNNFKEVYYWMIIVSYYISHIESFNINDHELISDTMILYLNLPNQNLKIYYGCFVFFLTFLNHSEDLIFIDDNKEILLFNIFKCLDAPTAINSESIDHLFYSVVITFLDIFLQEIPIKDDHLLKDQLMERICEIIVNHSKSFDLKINYLRLWNSINIYRFILLQFEKSETDKILKYYEPIKTILFRLYDLTENELDLIDLFYDVSSVIVIVPMVYDKKVCGNDLEALSKHILNKPPFKTISSTKIIDCYLRIMCTTVKALGDESAQLLPLVFSRFIELIKESNTDIKIQKLAFGFISKMLDQENDDGEGFSPINPNLISQYCELIYPECCLALDIYYKGDMINATEKDKNTLVSYASTIISTILDLAYKTSSNPSTLFLNAFKKVYNSIQPDFNVSTVYSKLKIINKMIQRDFIVEFDPQFDAIQNLIKLILLEKVIKWDQDTFIKEQKELAEQQQHQNDELPKSDDIVDEGDAYTEINIQDIFIEFGELIAQSNPQQTSNSLMDSLLPIILNLISKLSTDVAKSGLISILIDLMDSCSESFFSSIDNRFTLVMELIVDYGFIKNGKMNQSNDLYQMSAFAIGLISTKCNPILFKPFSNKIIEIFKVEFLDKFNSTNYENNLEFAKDNIISTIGSILKYQYSNFTKEQYDHLIDIFILNIPILNDLDEYQNIIDTIVYLLLNHTRKCLDGDNQDQQYLFNILESICLAHEERNISIPLEDASKIIKIFNENKQLLMNTISSLSRDHVIIIKSLFFKVNKFKSK